MSTERLSPAAAFEILGDDVRLDVLRTLADADGPLPFSELRERTGVRDSGRFNYHLDRLRDHFVRNGPDGYELRYHGERVVEVVLAGTFTDSAEIGPFPVEGTCYDCDGALAGVYEDERVVVTCSECDEQIIAVSFPPSAIEGRDPAEFMAAYEKWSQSQVGLAVDGVCPVCGGATEREFVDAGPNLPFDRLPDFPCTACGHRAVTSFAAIALRTDEVATFYADAGIDVEERPYWDVEPVVTGEYTTVESWDPLRVEVVFPSDADRLRVTLDDDLEVVAAERTP